MTRTRVLAVLSAAFVSVVVSRPLLTAQTPGQSEIEAQIHALERRFEVAQDTYDWSTLHQLYDADYIINSVTGLTRNRSEVAKSTEASAARTDRKNATTLRRVVREVHLHGDTVVTTGTVSLSPNLPPEQLDELSRRAIGRETRFLNVWVKKGGEWKLVASQLTRIEPVKPK